MAKTTPKLTSSSTSAIFTTIIFFSLLLIAAKSQKLSRNLSHEKLGLKKEKLSHLRFYFHDIVSGRNPTAIRVAEAPSTNKSATNFGAVVMIDDPLTLKPKVSSKEVGRAQGFYALASQSDFCLLMVVNFAFTEGKYNGSNLSILGRNVVASPVRELPVIGGSGVFRFARGYMKAKTHFYNATTGDAIVEYNVYVFHY